MGRKRRFHTQRLWGGCTLPGASSRSLGLRVRTRQPLNHAHAGDRFEGKRRRYEGGCMSTNTRGTTSTSGSVAKKKKAALPPAGHLFLSSDMLSTCRSFRQ